MEKVYEPHAGWFNLFFSNTRALFNFLSLRAAGRPFLFPLIVGSRRVTKLRAQFPILTFTGLLLRDRLWYRHPLKELNPHFQLTIFRNTNIKKKNCLWLMSDSKRACMSFLGIWKVPSLTASSQCKIGNRVLNMKKSDFQLPSSTLLYILLLKIENRVKMEELMMDFESTYLNKYMQQDDINILQGM